MTARGMPAAITAILLLAAAPVRAQDAHGAIAYGKTTQGQAVTYGFAWNFGTGDEAQAAARNACRDGARFAGGISDCEFIWFQNSCGALAVGRHGAVGASARRTQDQSEMQAMRSCEAAGGTDCAVVGSVCAAPGGEADTWSGAERIFAAREQPGESAPPGWALTREQRIEVQRALAELGLDPGPADGEFGPRTRRALRQWQQAKGLEATGLLTRDQAEVLAADVVEARRVASEERAQPSGGSRNQIWHFPEAGPKCEGMAEGSSCWRKLANKPGCYVWVHYFSPSITSGEWTGACAADTAHGRGTLRWSGPDTSIDMTGELMHGKLHGHWVERWDDGSVGEGSYVDGKRHGHWVLRDADGDVEEGPYVDGKAHGHWVERYASGNVGEGPVVDDKKHGRWVIRFTDGGGRLEVEYRDGSREGQPGVYITESGERHPGRWSNGCFKDQTGRAWLRNSDRTWEECER